MMKLSTFLAMALVGAVISGCGSHEAPTAKKGTETEASAEQSEEVTEETLDEEFAFPDIEKAADPEKVEPENVAYGTRRTVRTPTRNLDPAAAYDNDDEDE